MGVSLPILGVPGVMGSRKRDSLAPTVAITSDAFENVYEPFAITITFSEPVVGFVAGDVVVGNGTLSDFADSGDATIFTATITATAPGAITVDIPAGVCTDAAGNPNLAAEQLERTRILVYGAWWGKVREPALTPTDDRIGLTAAVGVDMTPVVNDLDNAEIYKDFIEATDSLGNVFIGIPRFYIRKTDGEDFKTWQVSRSPFPGAYLPWCFWDFTENKALDYFYIGKHGATLDGSNRLESKPGKAPLVSRNIVQFRTYAMANGAGYQQMDVHAWDVILTLFYIEFLTINTQSVMFGFYNGRYHADQATVAESGVNRIIVANATAALYEVGQTISIGTAAGNSNVFYGRTITAKTAYDAGNTAIEFDGTPVNIAVGNVIWNSGWISGFADSIAASSGSLVSNSNGRWPYKYRGIEMNGTWSFVDGVNINEYQGWVCPNAAQYASNLFAAPYEQLSYVNHNVNGYFSAAGHDADHPYAAFPTAIADGANGRYYSDNYYRKTGQGIVLVGGGWSSGASAGLSSWPLNGDSGYVGANVGGRLLAKTLL